MIPQNTTWEQQHQHVCTLCRIVQAHVKVKVKKKKKTLNIALTYMLSTALTATTLTNSTYCSYYKTKHKDSQEKLNKHKCADSVAAQLSGNFL